MNAYDQHKLPFDPNKIFEIKTEADFNEMALKSFQYQYAKNKIYRRYCELLSVELSDIHDYHSIPFLPISFFKSHDVKTFNDSAQVIFKSSGTTGMQRSEHHLKDVGIYKSSFLKGFNHFYGPVEDYVILGLLPSYIEQGSSSLVYMVDHLIRASKHEESGFFLHNFEDLNAILEATRDKKVMLIAVAYALLDFGEAFRPTHPNLIVMETGGMKGRRKELIKADLHRLLRELYPNTEIHSEYGMTELLSQSYSKGLKFQTPPWMKIITRSYSDPFELIEGKTGGLNIIDLANIHSCSFIATQDLGKVFDSHFEVVGRFDQADIRGCNLLVQ
ncbi:MAG: acyl transferase [Crocinitomicaceae bacterium]